jgi:DNA-binding response OmpR family regulator
MTSIDTTLDAVSTTTVLLADDKSAITLLFELELTRMGYQVLTAHCGSEAAAIGLDLSRPLDLLLTDWLLPDMKGDVLARILLAARPTLKVILWSGSNDVEDLAALFDPTRLTYLKKPLSPARVEQTMRILLGRSLHPNQQPPMPHPPHRDPAAA